MPQSRRVHLEYLVTAVAVLGSGYAVLSQSRCGSHVTRTLVT